MIKLSVFLLLAIQGQMSWIDKEFVHQIREKFDNQMILEVRNKREVIVAGLVTGETKVVTDGIYTYLFVDTNQVKSKPDITFFDLDYEKDTIHMKYISIQAGEYNEGHLSYSIISRTIFNNYYTSKITDF